MKAAKYVSIVGLVLLALLVLWLAMRNRQAPFLPPDDEHSGFVDAATCLACHGADGPLPRSRNHPLGDDCLRCHGRR